MFDDPDASAEIEKVLCRFRETMREINSATNDKHAQENIQRSWRLQDLVVLPPTVRLSHHDVHELGIVTN